MHACVQLSGISSQKDDHKTNALCMSRSWFTWDTFYFNSFMIYTEKIRTKKYKIKSRCLIGPIKLLHLPFFLFLSLFLHYFAFDSCDHVTSHDLNYLILILSIYRSLCGAVQPDFVKEASNYFFFLSEDSSSDALKLMKMKFNVYTCNSPILNDCMLFVHVLVVRNNYCDFYF